MAVGKKRTIAHIKGETGVQVLKKHLPAEWVPREYVPDYGIDLSIELFSPTEGGYVTKGEHVFFQVKATDSVEKVPYKIYPRMNVEKEIWGSWPALPAFCPASVSDMGNS